MKPSLMLMILTLLQLLPSCANKQNRTISSVQDAPQKGDIFVAPGQRIRVTKPSWVYGGVKDELKKPERQETSLEPVLICKCRLIREDLGGYDTVLKLGNDYITSEWLSCAAVNGQAPKGSGANPTVSFYWEEYDCKNYP